MIAALVVEARSKKKGKANGSNELEMILLGYYIKFGLRISRVTHIFWNKWLRHGEQANRNFGIKLLLSQNWGACVYTKIWEEKNMGTRSFQNCIVKGSIRCESISAGFDAILEISYFIDDISKQCQWTTYEWCRGKMLDSTKRERVGSKLS